MFGCYQRFDPVEWNLRRHVHVEKICTCAAFDGFAQRSAHVQLLMDLHMAGASYLANEHSKRVKDVQYRLVKAVIIVV
jgi:hypothetical protein